MARDVAALVRREGEGQEREYTARVEPYLASAGRGRFRIVGPAAKAGFATICWKRCASVHDEIDINRLTELVRERMLNNAWRELPQATARSRTLYLRAPAPANGHPY